MYPFRKMSSKQKSHRNGLSHKINMILTDLWLKPYELGDYFFHYLKIVAIEESVEKDRIQKRRLSCIPEFIDSIYY
jgi:hypothetical protein